METYNEIYQRMKNSYTQNSGGDFDESGDIAIRMMRTGEGPRKDTGKGQGATDPALRRAQGPAMPPKPDNVTDEEWAEHLAIMKAIGDYEIIHTGDEPFMPEDEMADPRLRWMRETLRQRYKFNKRHTT